MKTKFFISILTILFTSFTLCNAQISNAQEADTDSEAPTISKGLTASVGLNFSNLSGSEADSKMGFYASLGWNSGNSRGWIAQMDVFYSRGGCQADGGDLKMNLDYIGWKIDYLFKTVEDLYLGFGYGMSFCVSAKYNYSGETFDVEDDNFYDMSIPLVARYYFKNNLYVDARYNFGMFPTIGEAKFFGDGCNRGFTASVGIIF